MNRRNFFKGAVSVMAMAAILKGRVDKHRIVVRGFDFGKGPDRAVFAITNPPGDKTWVSTYRTTNTRSYPYPQKWA